MAADEATQGAVEGHAGGAGRGALVDISQHRGPLFFGWWRRRANGRLDGGLHSGGSPGVASRGLVRAGAISAFLDLREERELGVAQIEVGVRVGLLLQLEMRHRSRETAAGFPRLLPFWPPCGWLREERRCDVAKTERELERRRLGALGPAHLPLLFNPRDMRLPRALKERRPGGLGFPDLG